MSSPDGRIERINHAICAMTGYTEGGLLGTLLADLVHPDDRRAGELAVAPLVSCGEGPRRFESRYLCRDGDVIEASVGVSAIRDDDHGVQQLYTQIEDVTDARRTTRELAQAQFEMLARLAGVAELHDDDTAATRTG